MKKLTLIFALLMLFNSIIYAQPGQGNRNPMNAMHRMVPGDRKGGHMFSMLNLTDSQKNKAHDIQLQKEKELTPLRAEMVKLQGELRLLKLEKSPNLKAINSKIDQISQLKAKIMKIRTKYQMQFKNMLTDEQKSIFDQHSMHKKGKRGMGHCRCR